MPPKTKPDTGAGGQDGTALILEYLGKQNRPYSAIDVSANLHNKVTKSYAAKALKELAQEKRIEARTSGKQTVYHALQPSSPENSASTLANLDEEISQTNDELASLKTREKQARAELAEFGTRPLLSELRGDIARLEGEKEEVLAALVGLGGEEGAAVVEDGERERVEREWMFWRKQARVRKRICGDLWGKCSDELPEGMSREELKESLGLEGF